MIGNALQYGSSTNMSRHTFRYIFYISLAPVLLEVPIVDSKEIQPIIYNGISFKPEVELGYTTNDNVTNSDEEDEIRDAQSLIYSARLNLNATPANIKSNLFFDLKKSNFRNNKDNFFDKTIDLKLEKEVSERNGVSLSSGVIFGHQQRGLGITAGRGEIIGTPLRFRNIINQLTHHYGTDESMGEITTTVKNNKYNYLNFEEITSEQNWIENSISSKLYDNFARIKLVSQFIHEERNYFNSNRDNSSTFFLVGTAWKIGELTTGEIKIGRQKKDFELTPNSEVSLTSWEASIDWSPLYNVKVEFDSSRRSSDPERTSNAAIVKAQALRIAYNLNERTKLAIDMSYKNNDFLESYRSDKTKFISMSIQKNIFNFDKFSFYYTRTERKSTLQNFNFISNELGISFSHYF